MADLIVTPDMISSFREQMRAFGVDTTYPDWVVEESLWEAITETNQHRWGVYKDEPRNFRQRGIFYFAAHWLSIFYPTGVSGDGGNATQGTRLNPASKSVGDESISYRISAIQDAGDDWLSTTNYGVQFYRLRRRAAAGAVCV